MVLASCEVLERGAEAFFPDNSQVGVEPHPQSDRGPGTAAADDICNVGHRDERVNELLTVSGCYDDNEIEVTDGLFHPPDRTCHYGSHYVRQRAQSSFQITGVWKNES